MPKPEKVVTTPELTCLRESEKAFLFKVPEQKEPIWIPKSQIEEPHHSEIGVGFIGEIVITEWIAREKGLDE